MARCAGCGFLVVGDGEGELPAPTLHYRQTGDRGQGSPYDNPAPHCLVLAQNIREEYQERVLAGGAEDRRRVALDVVQRERECSSFFTLRAGCTPKEHITMYHAEALRREAEERRRADEERAEQRRLADEQRAQARIEEDRAWRKEEERSRREWQEKESKYQRWFQAGVAVFVAIIGALLTVLTGPWKERKEQPVPSQVNVVIPSEAIKK